jgi:hypothetical protein
MLPKSSSPEHRVEALRAFSETLEHRFPGSLDVEKETTDE